MFSYEIVKGITIDSNIETCIGINVEVINKANTGLYIKSGTGLNV